MKFAGGFVLATVGVTLLAWWELYVVPLAYTRNDRGGYGEIYGPVSFFREAAEVLSLLMIIVGGLLIYLECRRSSRTRTSTDNTGESQ